MRNISKTIAGGYASICHARTHDDAGKAYVDYHAVLQESNPDLEDLIGASSQHEYALKAIAAARKQQVQLGQGWTGPLLRGSGIIAIGNLEGAIVGVDYSGEESDPVAKQYPRYQKMAFDKMGRAAFLQTYAAGNSLAEKPAVGYYILQDLLEEHDIARPEDPPHTLGYIATAPMGRHHLNYYAAGASGILPSEPVATRLRQTFAAELQTDYDRGWVDWEHDEFAGAIDRQAGRTAVALYAGWRNVYRQTVEAASVDITAIEQDIHQSMRYGQRVH